MAFLEFPITSDPSGLVVMCMRRGLWRVLNSRSRFHHSARPLGFIERIAPDHFEVRWLKPVGWAYVDSFDAALAAIGDPAHFDGQVLDTRDPVRSPSALTG